MTHTYKCKHENCKKQPAFNTEGEEKGAYCYAHKQEHMVNVISPRCSHEDCKTRPVYNYSGETRGMYCKLHKLKDMINVDVKQRCEEQGCTKYPSYNYATSSVPIYCNAHKKPDMVNIISKRCKHENCNKIPSYNYKGETVGAYCAAHKLGDMVSIHACIEDKCITRANYNVIGQRKGLYCNAHKKEGMVDVTNRHCMHPGCIIRPTFNYDGKKTPLYCVQHKLDNMINVVDKRCSHEGCMTKPIYNYEHTKTPLYCTLHKLEDMINVCDRHCSTLMCHTRVHNDKYDGYCLRCFVHLFPDRPNSHNYKTKERSVVEYVQTKFPDKTIITDKRIQDGCSRRRPDILLDLGYQVVVIEVDENQHESYDCSCENKRIMEISQDVGHRPIIFIRFNPDDYLDNDNKNITSCWGTDNRGMCCVKKSKTKEWTQRLNVLHETLDYWMMNKSHKTVEIIQLFYDQNMT